MSRRSALLLTTSVARIPGTDRHTGAYASELAESWHVLGTAGYKVQVSSVAGGSVPVEALVAGDPVQSRMLGDQRMVAELRDSARPGGLLGTDYGILVLVGGHGAVFDLSDEPDVADLVAAVYDSGGVVASVCHGAAGLLGALAADGNPLVAGRRVAAFSDDEERAVGMLPIVPYLLSNRLRDVGAVHDVGPSFLPHVVVDGRLVTGQNPASTTDTVMAAVGIAARAGLKVPAG